MAAKKKCNSWYDKKKYIDFKSQDVIVRLYKALLRPRPECCVQAWWPYLRKDIDLLERVQKKVTKWFEGLKDKPYFERLIHTGLVYLENVELLERFNYRYLKFVSVIAK